MSNWTATNELRFVKREVREWTGFYMGEPTYTISIENILQQKWELNDPKFVYQSEWRDVPVVEEE